VSGALDDIRVIDLTRNVAGPYASLLLASQGADVIKLEPPNGDPSRQFGPFPGDEVHSERSGLFLHLNRYKRSVVIDAASTAGAAVIRALAAEAHIVLQNRLVPRAEYAEQRLSNAATIGASALLDGAVDQPEGVQTMPPPP